MDKKILIVGSILLLLVQVLGQPVQSSLNKDVDLFEPYYSDEKTAVINKREDTNIFNFPLKLDPEVEETAKTRTKREARRSDFYGRRKFIGSSVYAASIGKKK